jgi:hypothetical protein
MSLNRFSLDRKRDCIYGSAVRSMISIVYVRLLCPLALNHRVCITFSVVALRVTSPFSRNAHHCVVVQYVVVSLVSVCSLIG